MNIETERKYFEIVDKTSEQMLQKLPPELIEKIRTQWKRNITQDFIKQRKHRVKPKPKLASDSDDEYALPECENVLIGKLLSFKKKKPFWKAKLSGCILRLANSDERIMPKLSTKMESDFFTN